MFGLFSMSSKTYAEIAYNFKFNGIDGKLINLADYENKVLDSKKWSKHAINIIFEEFKSSFYGSSNFYFLFLMRMDWGGSTLKRSFFL